MLRKTLQVLVLVIAIAGFAFPQINKTAQLVDAFQFITGKFFSDGRHIISTRRNGSKITYIFKNNIPTHFIYTSPKGLETLIDFAKEQQRLEGAPRAAAQCTVSVNLVDGPTDCITTVPIKTTKLKLSNGSEIVITLCTIEPCENYDGWLLGG